MVQQLGFASTGVFLADGLARLASGAGSRAIKFRHLAEDGLGLGRAELAVLAVLLLRGPQTPGELKARSERMANLGSLADLERVLATLAEKGYARRLGRRPGQKEDRFEHLLGSEASRESVAPPPLEDQPSADGGLEARVEALEAEVADLRGQLEELRTDGRGPAARVIAN